MLKKQLLPSNADKAHVESRLLVQSYIGVAKNQGNEKVFNAL